MRMRKCHVYTFKQQCPVCGKDTREPRPARYSPEDRYGIYRRMLKRETKRDGK